GEFPARGALGRRDGRLRHTGVLRRGSRDARAVPRLTAERPASHPARPRNLLPQGRACASQRFPHMRIALLLAACLAALAFVTVAPSAQACTLQYCNLHVCNPFNPTELCTVCVQVGTVSECR